MEHVRVYSAHETTNTLEGVGFRVEPVDHENWDRPSHTGLKGVAGRVISSLIPQTRKFQIVRAEKPHEP